MKIRNLYIYIGCLLGFISTSCSDQIAEEIIPVINEKKEEVTIKVSISTNNPETYASTIDEDDYDPKENTIGSDLDLYIFDSDGVFETYKSLSIDNIYGNIWETDTFRVKSGNKYFYAFINTPNNIIPMPSSGSSHISFEKTILTTNMGELMNYNVGFFMGTLCREMSVIQGTGTPDNPEVINLKVGRFLSKVRVTAFTDNTPAVKYPLKGTFNKSQTGYRMINIAKRMYLIGQWDNGFRTQGSQVTTPFYYNYSLTTDIDPGLSTTLPNIAIGTYYYVLENTQEIPYNESATTFILRIQYIPDPSEIYDVNNPETNGVSLNNTLNSFWVAEFSNGTRLIYNDDPTGVVHAGLGEVKAVYPYPRGECYYYIPIADQTESTPSLKYAVIRNHSYHLTINSISGLGTNIYTEIPNSPDPVENTEDIEFEFTVVQDWEPVDILAELS